MSMAGHDNGLRPSHVAAATSAGQFWHIPQQNIDQTKTSPHVYVCAVSISAYSMAVHHVDPLFRDTPQCIQQSRKLHAEASRRQLSSHRASQKRSKVYPIAFYDGRVPAFSDFSGKRRRERSGLLPSTQATPPRTGWSRSTKLLFSCTAGLGHESS